MNPKRSSDTPQQSDTPRDNREFIARLMGHPPAGGQLFTVSLPGDPAQYPGYALTDPKLVLDVDLNHWFAVSTFRVGDDDKLRRRLDRWVALHVLAIDDVGTKIDAAQLLDTLGEPTAIVETSAGNEHWFYRLQQPCTNYSMAHSLVTGVCNFFGVQDMAGANRLMRMPYAINGKPTHSNEFDEPFRCSLKSWEFGNAFTPEDLLQKVGGALLDVQPANVITFIDAKRDPIYKALAQRGLIGHQEPWTNSRNQTTTKYVLSECPWTAEHTDQVPSGAAYIVPTLFNCKHDSCSARNFKDLREYLGVSAEEVDNAITATKAEENFTFTEEDTARLTQPIHPKNTAGRPDDLTELPVDWLWFPWIPQGMVSLLEGSHSLGKSTLVVSLLARLTNGKKMPDGFKVREPIKCGYLTSEEDINRVVVTKLRLAGVNMDNLPVLHNRSSLKKYGHDIRLPVSIDGLEFLIVEFGLKCLALDPVKSFCVGVNAANGDPRDFNPNSEMDVRAALEPLAEIAERTQCAIVLLRHWNKSEDTKDAKNRGSGSSAWAEVARASNAVILHPGNEIGGEERLALVQIANNVGPAPKAACVLRCVGAGNVNKETGQHEGVVVEWEESDSSIDANAGLAKGKEDWRASRVSGESDKLLDQLVPTEGYALQSTVQKAMQVQFGWSDNSTMRRKFKACCDRLGMVRRQLHKTEKDYPGWCIQRPSARFNYEEDKEEGGIFT